MTVGYSGDVGNASTFGCFNKIILRWRGSVYKLIYKELLAFKEIDNTLATAALATLDRHCWYLAPPVVMFSMFSKKVPDDTKARMAAKLLSLEKPEARLGLPEYPTVTAGSELWDFVQPYSWDFFTILRIEAD